jgi:hypothetical protein
LAKFRLVARQNAFQDSNPVRKQNPILFPAFPCVWQIHNPEKLWIEGISLILVAAGLLIEVVASHEMYAISDLQNAKIKQDAGEAMTSASHSESNSTQVLLQVAQLNKEAGDARKDAGDAMKPQ